MTDADFLHEILCNPDDDTPRLILADWLDEHRDPRGEFIRLQCQLAKQSEDGRRGSSKLIAREEELLARYRNEWLGTWPDSMKFFFARGLVAEVQADVDSLLNHEQAIFARHPIIYVRVTGGDANKLLKESACHKRWRDLNLWGTNVTDVGIKELYRTANLRSVDFGETNISDSGLKGIANLKNLQTVRLHRTKVVGPGIRHLAALQNLKELVVCCTKITGEGFKHLSSLSFLERLNLENSNFTDGGFKEIGQITSLKSLGLSQTNYSDLGLKELAPLKYLSELYLSGVHGITNDGIEAIAAFRNLRLLFTPVEITAAGFKELATQNTLDYLSTSAMMTDAMALELARLTNLRTLTLNNAKDLTDVAFRAFAGLKNLTDLSISEVNRVSDRGFMALRSMTELQSLNLGGIHNLTDAGLKIFGSLTKLRSLSLIGATQLTDSGLKELESLTNLRYLGIWDTKITENGLSELRKRLPEADIILRTN